MIMLVRSVALALVLSLVQLPPPAPRAATVATVDRDAVIRQAAGITRLHALIVAKDGQVVVERRLRGASLDRPVNIKSASKSVLSALAGIAIERGMLEGTDQPIISLLGDDVPEDADPMVGRITVGHLLSMQAGLSSTSGRNYGAWVLSRNWVRYVLGRPFDSVPGGRMIYSTGTSHLLSAVLTKASGRSTLALAREWLGEPLGITIPAWPRDPQGIYFGGNDMLMSPRALLAFGELYRNDGMVAGRRVLPEGWVAETWRKRAVSAWTGDDYGYGWFSRPAGGHMAHFAWGYGGQMVFVVPSLGLTVVMTSDPSPRPRGDGHMDQLHDLLDDIILMEVQGGES
ncbi:MAG TPA: serine hydrolase [Geminicoccus sp.]|jgi:CubicO group peptidase (beta-lactamase class C family)|uniref:serine hydrolase domain-containing protein n=1 Tax=Geminicoccus sp. TaxID=2024832 RepID=UPI002E2FBA6A|nr:serine hydrolase [Geminicoccus sp.]HEX2526564.1 serine hydrolase [Geminicoccus sp.]